MRFQQNGSKTEIRIVSNFTQIRRFIAAGHTGGGSAEDLDPPYKFEIRPGAGAQTFLNRKNTNFAKKTVPASPVPNQKGVSGKRATREDFVFYTVESPGNLLAMIPAGVQGAATITVSNGNGDSVPSQASTIHRQFNSWWNRFLKGLE
jgi:hypothetical protein